MTTIDDILREETLSPRAANFIKELASAIREAVEAEREACAKIASDNAIDAEEFDEQHCSVCSDNIAAAIRARGEEKGNG